MPYIILKRSDIPAGTLQVLDLEPNTSLRNITVETAGQTKYVNPVKNLPVVVYDPPNPAIGLSIFRATEGLTAWIITNVSDGTGARATGSIIIGPAVPLEGETVSVGTSAIGGPNRTFTFTSTPTTPNQVLIGPSVDATAGNLLTVLNNEANGLVPYMMVEFAGFGQLNLTAVEPGTAGNTVTLAATGANVAVSGATLAGGVDAVALTAAQASAMASGILSNLVRFGDLTAPAVNADLAAVNAELAAVVATANIIAPQLPDLLDLLAGRVYRVPAGVQIENAGGAFDVRPAVGAPGGPGFVVGTLRDVYTTGALKISVAQGELEGFLSNGFVYVGTPGNPNGEAVVVYNDDGTIFTP